MTKLRLTSVRRHPEPRVVYNLRASKAELRMWEAAKPRGMPLSTYVRLCAMEVSKERLTNPKSRQAGTLRL